MVHGSATVILAMGDGRRAAATIDQYVQTTHGLTQSARAEMKPTTDCRT